MGDFKISASLKAHDDDVRGIAFAGSRSLLSASRDATVRRWKLKSLSPPEYDDTILSHGSGFINAVTYLPPTSTYPEGLSISGGKDAIIEARQPHNSPETDPERMLLGHQSNVCALDVCPDADDPYVVSGSWDSSAMVWSISKGEPLATLEGHCGSVWAVVAYDHEKVLTGCADHMIRIFSAKGRLIREAKGSNDIVRTICKLPEKNPHAAHFASAGNDTVIRLWNLEGKELAQLSGHDNFIYSLAALPSGEIVSAGEDRTVRIWDGSRCIQTITHPAISVWAVAVDPETGDIASGASDRLARIFSRSSDRHADAETTTAFEDSVKASSIPKQTMGDDVNKEKLPGPDFLKTKSGTKEGQVQMIREPDGNISAHQWSHIAQQWINVGTVVDSSGSSGRKQEYLGKDYDYVFDVDVKEGSPPLKLPYNLSQNPYEVARKFIADNELPLSYLDQVADFIVKNTQGASLGQSSTNAGAPPPPSQPRPKILPQKEYLSITTANFSIITKKLQELNSQLLNDGRKDLSFAPGDLQVLPSFTQQLETAIASPTSSPVLDAGTTMVIRIATQWPPQSRVPGLDLLRCLAAANTTLTANHDILPTLHESGAFPSSSSGAGTISNPKLTMLAIRALANLFAHSEGRTFNLQNFEAIHHLISPLFQPSAGGAPNRNIHIAASTVCINYAVQLASSETKLEPVEKARRVRLLLKDLAALLGNDRVVDSETVYRALVAVGTLVTVTGARQEGEGGAESVEAAVKKAAARSKESRIKGVIGEMMG